MPDTKRRQFTKPQAPFSTGPIPSGWEVVIEKLERRIQILESRVKKLKRKKCK